MQIQYSIASALMFWCNVQCTSNHIALHRIASLTFIFNWMKGKGRKEKWNVWVQVPYKMPWTTLYTYYLRWGECCVVQTNPMLVVLYTYKLTLTIPPYANTLKLTVSIVYVYTEMVEGFSIYQDHIISVFTFICIYIFFALLLLIFSLV